MYTVEMSLQVLLLKKSMKLNHSNGNLNLSSNGGQIKITKSAQDNFVDSLGNSILKNQNVLLESSTGLDSIHMNMSETH
jgi:hypothetical protein